MIKKIDISTPKYPDTFAIVDNCDYRRIVTRGVWHAVKRHNTFYAARWHTKEDGSRTKEYMHRLVAGVSNSIVVDHRNRNGLDNRRENLRVGGDCGNQRNTTVSRNNKTGIKGVYFSKHRGHFVAEITVNRKSIYLGSFETAEEAGDAYDNAAKKYHGEYARTNAMIRAEKNRK